MVRSIRGAVLTWCGPYVVRSLRGAVLWAVVRATVVRASFQAPFVYCLTPRCARERGPGGPPHDQAVVRATVVRSSWAVVRATVVRSSGPLSAQP